MRQKTIERKIRGKGGATSLSIVDLLGMKATIKEKTISIKKLAEAKETMNVKIFYKILMKDTCTMSKEQRKKN